MTEKEKLIAQLVEKDLKLINKKLKEVEGQILHIEKYGFGPDIHKDNKVPILTELHYTQGYCNGYISTAESVLFLLNKNYAEDIKIIIKENKEIEKKNKKYLTKLKNKLTGK